MRLRNVDSSIRFVVNGRLCTSCGACAAVCPTGAINITIGKYGTPEPVVDAASCTGCGVCVRVCPGHSFDYPAFCLDLFGGLPSNFALGNYISCKAIQTRDKELLLESQSGGFISTMILACLEKGLIDGAIVSRRKKNKPFETETVVVRNREEVLSATGSIYNAIPVLEMVVSIVRETPGKYAFVGTPCQIQAMRKLEAEYPVIKKNIVLYLGLHCIGVFTDFLYDQILYKAKASREDVVRFRHRDKRIKGWPGILSLTLKNDNRVTMNALISRILPRQVFTNWRCLLCFDKSNEFSDISCGDCRASKNTFDPIAEQANDALGFSEIVIRTERGLAAWNLINPNDLFIGIEIDAEEIVRGNRIKTKKIGLSANQFVARHFGVGIPDYGVDFKVKARYGKIFDIINSIFYFYNYYMNRFILVRRLRRCFSHYFWIGHSVFERFLTTSGRSNYAHLNMEIKK